MVELLSKVSQSTVPVPSACPARSVAVTAPPSVAASDESSPAASPWLYIHSAGSLASHNSSNTEQCGSTAGVPHASASSTVRPYVSDVLHVTNASAARYSGGGKGGGKAKGGKAKAKGGGKSSAPPTDEEFERIQAELASRAAKKR